MAIGCIIASPLINKIGRKYTVLVILSIALVGMILQVAIPSYWGIMVGRMINAVSMVELLSSCRLSGAKADISLRDSKQTTYRSLCRSSALPPLGVLWSSKPLPFKQDNPALTYRSFYQWWQITGVLLSHCVVLRANIIWPSGDWSWRLGKSKLIVNL